MIFESRQAAGQQLIPKLEQYRDDPDAIVLGLPRGGIVTAFEIADGLHLPLDLVVPRKIPSPTDPEFAIGAIAEDGEGILNDLVISTYGISQEYIDSEVAKQKKEAQRRFEVYRGDRPPLDLTGKTALLVDDGIATGSTMLAAIASVKAKGAKRIVVAVPTTPKDVISTMESETDEFVYIDAPLLFGAVGAQYKTFAQTEDEEVIALMKKGI